MTKKRKEIVAAGTVTFTRREGKDPQLLVVHRPAYDDWTLPKGKLEPDEYEPVCASRETDEETGIRVRLAAPAGSISYMVNGGGIRKTVHFWEGMPLAKRRRKPDAEVDKVVWLTPSAALKRLTYDDEKGLVRQVLAHPPTTPLAIVRHAKAMERKNWSGRDQARPINGRGRKQSKALVPLLETYGIGRLVSSTSVRCLQTFSPAARQLGLNVEGWAVLSEEVGESNPAAVATVMRRFAKQVVESGTPTAVCGHRPVLPEMLTAIGVPPRPLQTAAVVMAHLGQDGRAVAVEWLRPKV